MPFQALPIAMRANTGDAVSKLVWIWLVQNADVEACSVENITISQLASFCQCDVDQARAALKHLSTLGLVEHVTWDDTGEVPGWFISHVSLNLPVSSLTREERRRIKASPDQIHMLARMAGYTCATCGVQDFSDENWHVDHIIPQSRGGADVEQNLQVLCPACNSRKSAKVHWVDFLGGRTRG